MSWGPTWRKQSKIERRLGDNWQRPKGMHHITHERLLAKLEECAKTRDEGLYAVLARLAPDLIL